MYNITTSTSIKTCLTSKPKFTNIHYKNKCKQNTQTTIMKKIMFTFIEISRRRSHEHQPSRTSLRLFTLPYKRQGKAGNCVKVLTVLCENLVPLKISAAKVCEQRNNKQNSCCCLHQVVNSGTQNCTSNKEFFKTKYKFIIILFVT